MNKKIDTIHLMLLIIGIGLLIWLGLLFIRAAEKTQQEAPGEAKYMEFIKYCREFNANEYLVIRNDIKEVYLKCSK